MALKVSILVTGSELLDARCREGNSRYLIEQLSSLGPPAEHVLVCDDRMESIKDSLSFLTGRSDTVVVSGGLGPTSDDLTREAISELIGLPLELDKARLRELEELHRKRGRIMDPSNAKQALFPAHSRVIPNNGGTACGFVVRTQAGCSVYALPGVPAELQRMTEETILPELAAIAKSEGKTFSRKLLRVFGLPEAAVGTRVKNANLPPEVIVSYRISFPQVEVVLKTDHPELSAGLDQIALNAATAIGPDMVFSNDGGTFEETLHRLFIERHVTLALAESCTGGMIGSMITGTPGASNYFLGSFVTYSNEAKLSSLSVSADIIAAEGAVSGPVARQMAEGAHRELGSTHALSVTGIAGPGGGSKVKPVGTFFVGYADSAGATAYKCFFSGTRERVRRYAAWTALDILRRRLLGLSVPHPIA